MLIYGNTPRDIMKMVWRRKVKLLSVAVLVAVAVMLIGCSGKQIKKPVKLGDGLNKFWDALGGKVLTKSKDE